jgi:RNA polymerase sigma-70 factor (ECF subfamily)
MIALKGISKFERRGLPFRVWLYRIATNEVNQWARGERRRLKRERAHAGGSMPHDAAGGDAAAQREEVRRALLGLSPKHQDVLALHHVEGLGVEQIARVLRRPVGTIKSRLLRARSALREALHERENDA